jgi:hypothetical protein
MNPTFIGSGTFIEYISETTSCYSGATHIELLNETLQNPSSLGSNFINAIPARQPRTRLGMAYLSFLHALAYKVTSALKIHR